MARAVYDLSEQLGGVIEELQEVIMSALAGDPKLIKLEASGAIILPLLRLGELWFTHYSDKIQSNEDETIVEDLRNNILVYEPWK